MNQFKTTLLKLILIFCITSLTAQTNNGANDANFAAYNNFDFTAGTKVVFFDDFSKALTKWKVLEFDASDDVEKPGIKNITNDATAWFKTPRKGLFFPIDVKTLPEEFTIEFDMWVDTEKMSEMEGGLNIIFADTKAPREDFSIHFDASPQIQLDIHPSMEVLYCIALKQAGPDDRLLDNKLIKNGWNIGKTHRVSISRNKIHIRLYINEKKYIDLPNGLPVKGNYTLILSTNLWGDGLYFSNFRLAEAPQQAPKFDSEGKFVTNAIYFNVNSAQIKPESWPALNQAATVIKASQGNITIVGHTDSDGNDEANMALSKKLAESVKAALIKNFGISASRLFCDGKGESAPIDKNDTPEDKANNRRVEFQLMK